MYSQRNIQARPYIQCCGGKAISVTYCECVFEALGIRHPAHMRHVILCGLTVFSTLYHKLHHFRKAKCKL